MNKLESFIDSCYHYFHAYQDKQSTTATPSDKHWADIKIATYFTVIAPLLVGIAYGMASLASLISRISIPSENISKTQDKAAKAGKQILGTTPLKLDDGGTYEGDLVNGVPEGTGTLHFSDGKKYVGGFRAGQMDGTGRLTMPSGKLYYEGGFEKGMKHGEGMIRTQDTVFYQGSFKYDKRDGKGVEVIPITKEGKKSYQIYQGEYINNLRHGPGKLMASDGTILFEGLFENGEPVTN